MRLYFEIHYSDDSIRRGETLADWQSMPDESVLVVTEIFDRFYGHPRKHGGKRYAGCDYYWMNDSGEIGEGNADQIPDGVHLKRAALVDDATWERIYNVAWVDPEADG